MLLIHLLLLHLLLLLRERALQLLREFPRRDPRD